MSSKSKTKERKTSPAGAFNVEKQEIEKRVKTEVERILNAPRYKQVKVRVLKNTDGKSRKRKSTKRKSTKRKSTKRKSTKRKSTKRKK